MYTQTYLSPNSVLGIPNIHLLRENGLKTMNPKEVLELTR